MIRLLKNFYKEIICSLIYFFQHILKFFVNQSATVIGNLDPGYLLAPMYIWNVRKDKKKLKIFTLVFVVLVFYSMIQVCFLSNINALKMIVTILKILICVGCMFYVKENYNKVNLLLIAKFVSILYAICLPLSFIFNESNLFWMTNDTINKYMLTRLRLFYYEPSELGFRVVFVLIILIGFFMVGRDRREKIKLSILIFVNLLVLWLSGSMGAICIGALSVAGMCLYDWITNNNRVKNIVYFSLVGIFVSVIFILVMIKNPLYNRLLDTFYGKDLSNNYRIGVSFDVLKASFGDYFGLGCGFGNVNTVEFISRYKSLGLVIVITNSFIYYIVESGIFGVITLAFFVFVLLKNCIKSRSAIKWGLFVFIIFFQCVGGYFTLSLNWVLYGLILSDFSESKN